AITAAQVRNFAGMAISRQKEPGSRSLGSRYSGHFAGLILIRTDAQKEPERRGSPVDQQAIEAMLADRARSLGIEVRRGCDVTGLGQQADSTDVAWASSSGDNKTGEGQLRCSYLVGCDGGRSA